MNQFINVHGTCAAVVGCLCFIRFDRIHIVSNLKEEMVSSDNQIVIADIWPFYGYFMTT